MPGEIVQFPDQNQIRDLLSKIIDYPITEENVTRRNNRITINVNFPDATKALPVLTLCREVEIEHEVIKHGTAKGFKFSFADNQTTVENLHEKLRKVIAERLVHDMNGTLSAFDQNLDMKKVAAKDILQAAEKAVNNPSHEIQNLLARPIVRRFLEDLDKNYKGSEETVKKAYAQQILKSSAIQLGIKPDLTPPR